MYRTLVGNLNGSDHLAYVLVDWRISMKMNRKQTGCLVVHWIHSSGSGWRRGGFLWTLHWNCGFHRKRRIS